MELKLKQAINNYLGFPLLIAIIFSVCLAPSFKIFNLNFSITLSDLLLPLVVIFLMFRPLKTYFSIKMLVTVFLAFAAYVLFTIALNGRMGVISDYFEVYKIIKGILFLAFSFVVFDFAKLKPYLRIALLLLIGFNFLHYFNIFDFNNIVEPFYASDVHLKYFGLNSAGQPASKRILGTMGNPNNNAILFMFFVAIFTPFSKSTKIDHILFIVSVSLVILCQSRTGFVALLAILVFSFIFIKANKYIMLTSMLVGCLMFFISDFSYIKETTVKIPTGKISKSNNTTKTKEVEKANWDLNNKSLEGRFEVWEKLVKSYSKKPVFGYGPNKEYFYERKMYPEGSYVLWLWRYGAVGFLFFMSLMFYIFWQLLKNKNFKVSSVAVLFFIALAVTSITNTPLANQSLSVLFFIIVGGAFKPNKS